MGLTILEGLDRTGKTTVAKYFESIGYEVIHLSAPPKDISNEQYLQDISEIIASSSTKEILLDRSHYGEMIWPSIYNRKPVLSEDDINALKELEDEVGTTRILMHDPNVEAHWQRCIENNEPLTKVQFIKARSLYNQLINKFNFHTMTLQQFIEKHPEIEQSKSKNMPIENNSYSLETKNLDSKSDSKSMEQIKLEKANAINDILSKKILKSKNNIYDELESEIREFLNLKLSSLFGTVNEVSLTKDEIRFYKAMYKKALKKGE